MAARPLSEAVQQAEEAISGGNYQLAVETCRRVLGQFPEFATAHRLLGEAHLEAGDTEAATQAFHETLQRDPQSSAAYAGLSTISEGRGDVENALAYAQVAWEINPQRADLRDRVASLSERLYGKGGRLHLTRPALTSLHFRAGRWSRAAAEASAVVSERPTRVDVQLRMAEALWRRGNLTAAGNACRAVLESSPSAVMALLMLADVERRAGNQESAAQLLERARAIDPDGVRAADLVTIGSTDLAEFILPAKMPEFDDTAEVTAEVERPRIAPAPDFSFTQPEAEKQATDTDITEKLVAEAPVSPAASAVPAAAEEGSFDVSLPDDAEIEAARPPARAQRGFTSMLQSLEGEGLMPFRLEGDEGAEADEGDEPAAEADDQQDVFSLVSDAEIEAARPPEERPHGYTTLLNSLDQSGVAPFEIEGAPGYPAEASASVEAASEAPSEPVDYGTDLTAGWDDIDAEIQRATPSDEAALRGYTRQLRDLDEIGVQPFSIEGVDAGEPYQGQFEGEVELDDAYGADLSFLDAAPEAGQASGMNVEAVAYDADLTDGWAAIDEEIQNAIPAETPPGYTDELNELNKSGVEPFFVEAEASEPEPALEYAEPSTISEEDVVSDDLAAGLDLWSVGGETTAEPVEDAVPAEPDAVSTSDLFDFVDVDTGHEVMVDAGQPAQWDAAGAADEMAAATGFEGDIEATSAEAPVTEMQPDDAIRTAIARLGVDAGLFERARQAKMRFVEAGQIQGDQLLPGVEPPGPTLDELERMLQESPEDLDARRQFVGALLDAEQFDRAYGEFQWMFRQRLPFEEQDLANLTQVAERSADQQESGHRLLGAVYRRSGNLGMSARHYRMSLVGYRAGAEKEA